MNDIGCLVLALIVPTTALAGQQTLIPAAGSRVRAHWRSVSLPARLALERYRSGGCALGLSIPF